MKNLSILCLSDSFCQGLLKYLQLSDIMTLNTLCKSMHNQFAEDSTWSRLIIDRVAKTSSSSLKGMTDVLKNILCRIEKMRRTALDIEDPDSSDSHVLLCHEHAARGFISRSNTLDFHLYLPVGHYCLRGIMNTSIDIRQAEYVIFGALKTCTATFCTINTRWHTCDSYVRLKGSTLIQDEPMLDKSCTVWDNRETFTITSYQPIEIAWSICYDMIFEELKVIQVPRPHVNPCNLILGAIETPYGIHHSLLNCNPLVIYPLSFAAALEDGNWPPRKSYLRSDRAIDGAIVNVEHPEHTVLQAMLPDVLNGAYTVFFSFYCHKGTNPNLRWQDAYFWTCFEIEALVVATPRTLPFTLRRALILRAEYDEDLGVSLIEGESYIDTLSVQDGLGAITSIKEIITRDECASGLNEYVLSKPLFVPRWSTQLAVVLNMRLPSGGVILLGSWGLRPLQR